MNDHVPFEVTPFEELVGMGLLAARLDEPWVGSVQAFSHSGTAVTVSWNELEHSVSVRALDEDVEWLVIDREGASKLAISEQEGVTTVDVWSMTDEFSSHLRVLIGDRVTVSDSVLRN